MLLTGGRTDARHGGLSGRKAFREDADVARLWRHDELNQRTGFLQGVSSFHKVSLGNVNVPKDLQSHRELLKRGGDIGL
jgi:hypothetical protein